MTSAAKRLTTGDEIRLIAPFVIYAILAFAAWKLGYFREQKVEAAARTSTSSAVVGAVFVIIYGSVSAVALPVTLLAYGAGAIFGFWRAALLVWVGSMLGAVVGYYLARGIWAKPARRLLGHYNEKLRSLRKGNVFLTALRVQLLPVIPFGPFNYAAGISKFDPLQFLAATALGIVPGTLMATFIGAQLAAGVHGKSRMPYVWGGIVAAIAIALTFAPKLWDNYRNKSSGN
ncbi:MAG TPA: VTT domain-containing protein [Gemmatimonadaceae bacterium]|nr:VTT domain-containing protein [Gemmatimonadaceae bacterium]